MKRAYPSTAWSADMLELHDPGRLTRGGEGGTAAHFSIGWKERGQMFTSPGLICRLAHAA